jgi:hypothetical protein
VITSIHGSNRRAYTVLQAVAIFDLRRFTLRPATIVCLPRGMFQAALMRIPLQAWSQCSLQQFEQLPITAWMR